MKLKLVLFISFTFECCSLIIYGVMFMVFYLEKRKKRKKKLANVWFCLCHYHHQQLLTKSKPESNYENIKFKSK